MGEVSGTTRWRRRPATRINIEFAANGISDADVYIQWHVDGAERICERGELELYGRGSVELHNAADAGSSDGGLHLESGRKRGRLHFQRARGGNGPKRDYARRRGHAACGGLLLDGAQSKCAECGARRNVRGKHISGHGGGKFCGDGGAELFGRAAFGAACAVLAIECGESDGFGSPVTVTLTVTAAAGTPVGGPTAVTISAMTTGAPAAKTQTFGLTVTGPTSFKWTDTGNASVTVLAGQSASYTFSASPAGGGTFSSAVSFACSGLPAWTSCGFSPASIAAGAGTTAVALTISTAGPNSGIESRPQRKSALRSAWTAGSGRHYASARSRMLPLFTLAWVAAMGIVGLGRTGPRKRILSVGIAGMCLGLGLMALISCGGVGGGGTSSAGPPPTFRLL